MSHGLPISDSGNVSFAVDVDFRMQFATYDFAVSSNAEPCSSKRFAVRCVARGPDGAAGEYTKKDVSIDD